MSKSHLVKEGLILSYSLQSIHHPGQSAQGAEAGSKAVAIKEYCFLACLLLVGCSACFLIVPRTTSKGSRAHSEVGSPTSIKNVYHRLAHKPIWREYFLNEAPSSQMT